MAEFTFAPRPRVAVYLSIVLWVCVALMVDPVRFNHYSAHRLTSSSVADDERAVIQFAQPVGQLGLHLAGLVVLHFDGVDLAR